jgi:hypothetical protein
VNAKIRRQRAITQAENRPPTGAGGSQRNDEGYLDALGATRIPDPTSAGDFCRRFDEGRIDMLQEVFNDARVKVWSEQPADFFYVATINVDATTVETTGECKQGMDINYKNQWGYMVRAVSLANTGEPPYIVNRPGNRPSHEQAAGWLAWREAAVRPMPGYVEDELRGYLACGLLCFGFARAVCMTCRTGFVVAFSCKGRGVCPSCNGCHMAQTVAHLADHVIPPVPVRQWVISVPKRLRGMLADRPRAVAALTKLFLDEIERLLLTASGGAPDAVTPGAPRPRLGGISFLHRFGSALNHHVHLHACVTDGVFVPAANQAGCDAPPTFLPARPVTAADLAALTERVRRRVIRGPDGRISRVRYLLPRHKAATWVGRGRGRKSTRPGANGVVELSPPRVPRPARRSRPAAAEAPAPLPRGVCAESQAQAGLTRHDKGEYRQAARGHDRRACGPQTTHGWLLRRESKAPLARHLPDCLGEFAGPGRRGVPARVPSAWRRHPADRLHHRTGADPKDPHAPGQTTRTAADLSSSWPAHRLGRARASER